MRRVIHDLCGRRAGALRVDEGVGRRERRFAHEAERILKVLLGLTGEANDDVGGQGKLGHGGLEAAHKREILLARVAPVHGAQDAGGATLHGQVQMRHDGRRLGHGGDDLVGQVLGVGRGETQPLDAGLAHCANELGEPRLAIEVTAV